MSSKTLSIEMAPRVAFTSLAPARKVVVSGRGAFDLAMLTTAHAFTAYQFVELVERLVSRASAGPVVITGPCSTFFDEDVSFIDATRLFYRVLWRIVELARGGMSFLLAQSEPIKAHADERER